MTILTQHEPGVTAILLNRPEARNALTPQMFGELDSAIRDTGARGDAIVLGGAGPVFCSGFDLKMCLDQPGSLRDLLARLSETIRLLRSTARPVVIAAQGGAIAGGCALLGGADVVVTDRNAKLGYPVLRIGVSPAISAPFLSLATGAGPARTRMLDTGLISGKEAMRLGLAHTLVEPPGDVLPRALEIARELGAKPPGAFGATKRWLDDVSDRGDWPERALEASLSLTGGEEERRLLRAMLR